MANYPILLACPIIIGIGNLVLGPIFSKHIPFKVQMRSFLVGTMIYLLLATIGYYLLRKNSYVKKRGKRVGTLNNIPLPFHLFFMTENHMSLVNE